MAEWTDPIVIVGIAQIFMALVLALFTAFLWKSTDNYAKISDETLEFSRNQADIDAKKRKYNRLSEEMDKLVAPLYIAYRSTQAKNSFGFFQPLDQRNRWTKEAESRFLLWDGIKKNMHLSQSEELRNSISKYFFANDNYFMFNNEKSVEKDFCNAKIKLIQVIMKRYPELVNEIILAERELGIRKEES